MSMEKFNKLRKAQLQATHQSDKLLDQNATYSHNLTSKQCGIRNLGSISMLTRNYKVGVATVKNSNPPRPITATKRAIKIFDFNSPID